MARPLIFCKIAFRFVDKARKRKDADTGKHLVFDPGRPWSVRGNRGSSALGNADETARIPTVLQAIFRYS